MAWYNFSVRRLVNHCTQYVNGWTFTIQGKTKNKFGLFAKSTVQIVVLNSLNDNEKITTTFRCHSDVNINNLVAGVRDMTDEYFAICDRITLDRRTDWFLDNLWRLYNRHCHKKTKTLSCKRLVKGIGYPKSSNFPIKLYYA